MTDIEQEARDRLDSAWGDRCWDTSNTRATSPSVKAMCLLLEEFAAFKQDASNRAEDAIASVTLAGGCNVTKYLKPLVIERPDPLYDSVRAALPGSMPDHHTKAIAKNLATELAKHGGKIVFEGEG